MALGRKNVSGEDPEFKGKRKRARKGASVLIMLVALFLCFIILMIGFITDFRLCKYLNLRFTPGIEFLTTTLHYKSASGLPVQSQSGTFCSPPDPMRRF